MPRSYFDSKDILQAEVEEREPIARVHHRHQIFYIDVPGACSPLVKNFLPGCRCLPGFPSEAMVLTKADSNLLMDIKAISPDPAGFVDECIDPAGGYHPARTFEMVPYIGEQVIVLGDARPGF